MTFFLANAASPFEDTRVGAVSLRVTTDGVSVESSGESAGLPLLATIEAFSVITTAFWSSWTLTSHVARFTTTALY